MQKLHFNLNIGIFVKIKRLMNNLNEIEKNLTRGKVSISREFGSSKSIGVVEYERCNFELSGDYLIVMSKESDTTFIKSEVFALNTIIAYIRYL